jgi:predicted dehydrogenase
LRKLYILLSHPASDIYYKRLPILVQPEYIKKALLAEKHVFSEKAIAKDYATAKGLIDWYHNSIDSKSVFWGVAKNYRFIDSLSTFLRLLKAVC